MTIVQVIIKSKLETRKYYKKVPDGKWHLRI